MPVTHSAFLDQVIAQTYPLAVRVDYLPPGGAWTRMDNALVAGLAVVLTGGSVTSVRDSRVRRTATLTFGGAGSIPIDTLVHPISPLNAYRVYRGALRPDGTEDLVLLGTFDPNRLTIDRPAGSVSLDLVDYMQRVEDDALQTEVEVDDSVKVVDVIKRLLINTDAELPGILDPLIVPTLHGMTLSIGAGIDTTMLMPEGQIFSVGASSRGDAVDACAGFLNGAVIFDETGQLTLYRMMVTVTPTPAPTYVFTPGDGGNYTELSSGWSFDGFANDVSIINGDFVVHQAITSGPFSPASFGRIVRYSEDVSDQAMDEDATTDYAARVAAEHLGLARQVQGTCLAIPWLIGGDLVTINYPVGNPITGMLDSYQVPLTVDGAATFTLREYVSTTGL